MPAKPKNHGRQDTVSIYDGWSELVKTAIRYGFTPQAHVSISDEDRKIGTSIDSKETHTIAAIPKNLDPETKDKAALLRLALEGGAQGGQPWMSYQEKVLKDKIICSLDIIGNSRGVAEGIIIATGIALLKESGVKNPTAAVNCVGDRDSSQRFLRALGEYYKKNAEFLPAECRAAIRKDVLTGLSCGHEKCTSISESAPRSMNFLSEQSRKHFKEVLEYLEGSGIEYTIADDLMPTKSYMTQTVFHFYDNTDKKPVIVGFGGRYNSLSKRIGSKRELGAVGLTLSIDTQTISSKKKQRIEKPRLFLIHVGTEARFRSLAVIEMLREANIPLAHGVIKDKLSSQIAEVESLGAEYTLLIGQKECIEHSIIVRNNTNRSQNSVKIEELVTYLKKLGIA